jgi:deoxynucleoside triphosphate triphosphohydrolase SAMHD1
MLLNSTELFGTPRHLVMDPVHGGIPFFTHEQKVLDHPLCQRLRHIKQNDILHFVFPGATHTRFEHCLGTMHVAGRIFKNMIRNYLTNRGQLELTEDQIDAVQYCYGCLRLAALLHDVGHMPFSHQFEEAEAGRALLKCPDIVSAIWTQDLIHLIGKAPQSLRHEHYSLRAAHEILTTIKKAGDLPFDENDIIGMMEDGSPPPSQKFCDSAVSTLNLFSKVPEIVATFPSAKVGVAIRDLFKDIISGEIDADKMDYLLRDSYFSGCNYGSYNIDHLTQNICVGFDMDPTEPWVGVALNKKGLGALEDFVHSRFRMYLQVYGHKTVVGFKWLVREAVAEILKDKETREVIKRALTNMDDFTSFADTFCWEAFRAYARKHPRSACGDLVQRRKLCHVAQIDDQVEFEKRNQRTALEKELECKILQHECASRFSKINPSFARMRLLVKDPVTGVFHLEAITKRSTFFNKFQNVTITHYYRMPEWGVEKSKTGANKAIESEKE